MRIYDIIYKKRNGQKLSDDEIQFMIDGYVKDEIKDYQMSALLMAIFIKGMTDRELYKMTLAMAYSGNIIDLSEIDGIKVDKHSTGGVGDKTTIIIAPIAAACGVKIAKMSGKGLGHTGGTIDKLESINGFKTTISQKQFFEIVKNVGASIVSQTENLAPADKKIYALRDVTATVDSIPLIAASVMSKKLAAGSDCILLDVKVGSGAFMKNIDDAIALSKNMVSIGESAGKKTIALITNMDMPLGNNIGNCLEIKEAIDILIGKGDKDLIDICVTLSAYMIYMAKKAPSLEIAKEMAKDVIQNGKAFEKFIQIVEAHGGDTSLIKNTDKFQNAKFKKEIISNKEGYISKINTEQLGNIAVMLGAGRKTKDSKIDPTSGIIMCKKTTDFVKKGDVIAYLFTSLEENFINTEKIFLDAISFDTQKPQKLPLILGIVTKDTVQKFI